MLGSSSPQDSERISSPSECSRVSCLGSKVVFLSAAPSTSDVPASFRPVLLLGLGTTPSSPTMLSSYLAPSTPPSARCSEVALSPLGAALSPTISTPPGHTAYVVTPSSDLSSCSESSCFTNSWTIRGHDRTVQPRFA
jgi:hypothetical protein